MARRRVTLTDPEDAPQRPDEREAQKQGGGAAGDPAPVAPLTLLPPEVLEQLLKNVEPEVDWRPFRRPRPYSSQHLVIPRDTVTTDGSGSNSWSDTGGTVYGGPVNVTVNLSGAALGQALMKDFAAVGRAFKPNTATF